VSHFPRIFVRSGLVAATLLGTFFVEAPRATSGEFPTLEQSYREIRKWLDDLEAEHLRRSNVERKDWHHDREALEHRLALARETVMQSFDVYDRGILQTSPEVRAKFHKSKVRREQMLHRLIEYRNDSAGKISNGDAENFFLELCGSSAFAGQFDRSTKLPNAKKDPSQGFLSTITSEYRLRSDVIHHIIYKRGLTGPRLTGRINQEPLEIEFPEVLRGPDFSPRIAEIKKCRDAVLQELHAGKPVSSEVADALLKAVNDLVVAVKEKKAALMQEVRLHGQNDVVHREWDRFNRVAGRLHSLLQGAYRLIEAVSIDDVAVPPLDEKNGVTIEELMAYMHTNNLYFFPADPNGEAAYNMVFEMMSRYYIDLVMLKNAERGLAAQDEEERRLTQLERIVKMFDWTKQSTATREVLLMSK
jgi:hypothetical protein